MDDEAAMALPTRVGNAPLQERRDDDVRPPKSDRFLRVTALVDVEFDRVSRGRPASARSYRRWVRQLNA
jgi:hypothetical protein